MKNQSLELKYLRDKALLADDVYKDTNESQPPKGWQPLSEFKDNASGYFGRAYINDDTNEIVVAHRGTQIEGSLEAVKDLTADAVLAFGKDPAQLNHAEKFTQEVMAQISDNDKYNGYAFSHTGHSLGGYLADVVSAKEGQSSFSIDAPGSKSYMQEHLNASEFLRAEKNHISIIGPGDLVSNTAIKNMDVNTKDHIGQVFVLENFKATPGDIANPFHLTDYHKQGWYVDAIDNEFKKNPGSKLTDIENVFKLPASRYDYRTNIDIGDNKGLVWNFHEKLSEIANGLGIEAETLKNFGAEPDILIAAGYSATDLIEVGYSSKEFNAAGLSPNQLLSYGLNVEDLKTAGYSADSLVKSGITLSELVQGGYKSQDLDSAGLSPDVLVNEGLSLEQINSAGYTANDLDRSGIEPQDLIDKGYDISTLKDIGYTVGDLANANVTLDKLKEVYSNDELKKEFTSEELEPKQVLTSEPETELISEPEVDPGLEPEPVVDLEPESGEDPGLDAEPEIDSELEPVIDSGLDAEPEVDPELEPDIDLGLEEEPEPVLYPITDQEPADVGVDNGVIVEGEPIADIDNGSDDALNQFIKEQIDKGNELLTIKTNNVDNGIYPDDINHIQNPAGNPATDSHMDALNQEYERTQREIQNLIKDDGYRPIDPRQYESNVKAPEGIDLNLDDFNNDNDNSSAGGSEDVHTQV